MRHCWICGSAANSKEHKFKASDIKRALGKKFNAFYINGNSMQEFNSYKDDLIQFPKVICVECNTVLSRPHDDAYDLFVNYCFKNNLALIENGVINFEAVFGDDWLEKKIDLYRYFAKHAGCKVATSGFDFDLTRVANFIKGRDVCEDFVLKFEIKQALQILIILLNKTNPYTHLYNGATVHYGFGNDLTFGGWTTVNFLTANWIIGKNICDADHLRMYKETECILLTDSKFFDEHTAKVSENASKLELINEVHTAIENGYNKTLDDKINFFENIIATN